MTLGELKKATEEMPDDLELRFCNGDVIGGEEMEYKVSEVDMAYSDGEYGFLFLNGDKV